MNVDLVRKSFCCFGLRGTGKSTLANHIADQFKSKALVYDTLREAPINSNYDIYQPRIRNSVPELEAVIARIKQSQYKLFMIDETNRFAPSKPVPLPAQLADLNDQCRHYGLTVGYIARRPCQLNQDLTELADYLFIFHLKGKGDIRYLDDISSGLGDAVLSLHDFQFVLVMPDRSFTVQPAITPDKNWLDAARRHLTS